MGTKSFYGMGQGSFYGGGMYGSGQSSTEAIEKELGPDSIVSFNDGLKNKPLKECVVNIEPVQDLHGYDNPWPAGGGKNKLPNTYITQTINGVTFTVYDDGSIKANGTASARVDYYLSGSASGGSLVLPSGNYIISYGDASLSTSGLYMQFAKNGTATTITGSSTFGSSELGWIRLIITNVGAVLDNVMIYPMIRLASVSDPTYSPYSNICPITGWTGANIYVSPTDDPADGRTYSVAFPTEAGTVYGGTLDVTSGVLTVDRAMVDLGTLTYPEKYSVTQGTMFRSSIIAGAKLKNNGTNFICSNYKTSNQTQRANGTISIPLSGRIDIIDNRYADASTAEFQTAMFGVQFVYELATPVTHQLTPVEIQLLFGENNIWTDVNNIDLLKYKGQK